MFSPGPRRVAVIINLTLIICGIQICPVGPSQAAPRDSHNLHLPPDHLLLLHNAILHLLLHPISLHLYQHHLPKRILIYGNLLNLGRKSIVPPVRLVNLLVRQEPQNHLLTVIQKDLPEVIHQLDIVSQTNTSTSTERKNVKARNCLNHQIGDIELLQIPVRIVMPLRKTGLTNQTKVQHKDMSLGHVKAGTT